jgi:copper resistance protein B
MTMNHCITLRRTHRSVLLAALLLALPLAVAAQSAPASSSTSSMDMRSMPGMVMPASAHSASKPATKTPAKKARTKPVPVPMAPAIHDMHSIKGMDHSSMPGMDHDAMSGMPMPAKPAASAAPAGDMSGMDHSSMPSMSPQPMKETEHPGMSGMDHGSMQCMDHGSAQGMDDGSMSGMTMGPMQGGSPPPDARDPDYSAGVGYGPAGGIHEAMDDNAPHTMLLIDQLEAFHGKDGNGQQWDIEGWYGNDYNKLWLRTEGERSGGKLEDGAIEAFWSHTIATFWNTQLGVRTDAGEGPNRQWAAFGIQGLAPYWFELEATGYVGPAGRTAARFRAEYELFLTQRLILQPEFEANAYGKDDPARRMGSGLSDASLGLRLRYEFHRQFAPYLGVVWSRRFGGTADFARQDGQGLFDRQWVAGIRIWF